MTSDNERAWDNVIFIAIVCVLGFLAGEVAGRNLPVIVLGASVLAVWGVVFILAMVFSSNVISGITGMAIVWSIMVVGAILGSIVSQSRFGIVAVPITLVVAVFAASRYPAFGLLLATLAAGALLARIYMLPGGSSAGRNGTANSKDEWSGITEILQLALVLIATAKPMLLLT